MITQQEITKLRIAINAPMSDEKILEQLIREHKNSEEYKAATDGINYYKKDQAIKSVNFQESQVLDTVVNEEGKEVEKLVTVTNPNRSNHTMQHRFLYNHVEQKVAYISGKEPSITVDGAEPNEDGTAGNEEWNFQNELAKTTDANFRKILQKWLREASIGGKAWLHEYKDKDGKLKQVVISRKDGIPIYDTVHEVELMEFIRFYVVNEYKGEKKTPITHAEWWTAEGVTFFKAGEDGKFSKVKENPHYERVTTVTGSDGVTKQVTSRERQAWGRVPFIELSNNSDGLTDLHAYKDLIDAYDLVASKGTNNLMDFNEFFAIIQGYGGDAASAIIKKLEVNRAVNVASTGGSVHMQQLDLQMQGRINWLQELWDAIHYFGCAVDTSKDNVGNAASGTSLEFQYSLLDLKANNMIIEAEVALANHFWFVTEDINRQQGTKYDADLVSVEFHKSKITNKQEIVSMIVASEGLVPEKTLIQTHPLVKDADQAYKDLLAEREEKRKDARAMFGGGLPTDEQDEE